MHRRMVAAVSSAIFAVTLLLGAAPRSPALADDCNGMSHYEYDHGECVDKAGDTTDIMMRAGDQSTQQLQSMLNRERGGNRFGSGSGGGNRVDTRAMARAMIALLSFVPASPSPAFAAILRSSKPSERARDLAKYKRDLVMYRRVATLMGLSPSMLSSSFTYLLITAHYLYDGDQVTNENLFEQIQVNVLMTFSQMPSVIAMTKTDLQRTSDTFGISAIELRFEYDDAVRRHDQKAIAAVRTQALGTLRLFKIDPATTSLDRLACGEIAQASTSCDRWEWILTNGKKGTSPFAGL